MREWLTRLLISVLLGLFGAYFYGTPWSQNLEYQGLDLWFHLRGPLEPTEEVILVALDEESFDQLQVPMNSPWPRALHAQLLQRLARSQARKVVFDVIFGGPSGDPEADEALAEAFGALPTAIGVEIAPIAGEEGTVEAVYLPYKPFQATVGELASVKKSPDGLFLRRFSEAFFHEELGESYRTLAQAGANLPTDAVLPDANDLIWFYGPARTIKTFSFSDALDEEFFLDEDFKDKIIYVGLSLQTALGPAQKDAFRTSFGERGDTFGVEVHATAALNLLHNEWIRRYDIEEETTFLAVTTALVSLLLLSLSPGFGLGFLVLSILGWMAAAYYSFLEFQFLPGITMVGVILPSVYLVSTTFSYLAARKKQKQTEEAFSHYLSPEMAKEVSQNPDALNLGGETITATALFTDIADFTKISESMVAEEVVQMLNSYFTEVMDAIFETRGTLIKFIGDAVFALWGAPVAMEDHELQTVKTALAIREKVKAFNKSGKYPELHTRIGVHSGPMVVGNLGSRKRFDYTAIGDSVNLAARLEGLNKYFGIDLLFSGAVEEKLPHSMRICPLGKVAVKGKSEAVNVFTILETDVPKEHEETWNKALSFFHAYSWDEAEEKFKELLIAKSYFMKSAQLYLQQIPYRKITGTEGWQGEITFEVK